MIIPGNPGETERGGARGENVDYILVASFGEQDQHGGHNRKDYEVSAKPSENPQGGYRLLHGLVRPCCRDNDTEASDPL